ncbi:MAG TPA: HEAT repeat domain-containing protein [Candidatus Krumholzibacteria bacterium]|nr:HEAT repeat domain-containing protein [Candidatus Krumholzibacteria bacterium]
MITHRLFMGTTLLACALALGANSNSRAASRYAPLMASSAGQDTLRNLALWEDQRVTGNGKIYDYLQNGSPLVRRRAVEALGRMQEPSDAARLIPLLKERDSEVLRETIFALGQIGNREAVAPLLAARSGALPDVAGLIAEALGKLGGDEAIAALDAMQRDFATSVRADAALALARTPDPNAANALLLAVHDPDPSVMWRAAYALEKQTPMPRSCTAIQPLLENDDPLVRAYAVRSLGKLQCKQAGKPLASLLKDADLRVVVNAARALGEIKDKGAVHPLAQIIADHESHHARAAAAEALGKIDDENGKDALAQGLLDTSAMVRINSIRALAEVLGENAEMFCDQMRRDGSRLVRAEAIRSYGTAGLAKRASQIDEIARTDKDPLMRAAAIEALAKLKDAKVAPLLVPALRDADFTVATAAVVAIGDQQYKAAVPALMDAYRARPEREFVDVQLEAVRVLGDLGALESEALLVEATSHDDARVRAAAVASLKKLGLTAPELPSERTFHEQAFDPARKKQLAPPAGTRHAVIATRHGAIEIELFGDDAIQTVANFIHLAKSGFYKKLTTHRVVPNFVVQGGDPRGDGSGDAGYTVPAEVSRHHFGEGFLGIADAGKDTGSCQWFITLSPQRHLDGRYTIFGRVTKGMDVVWKIDQGDAFDVKILD